MILSILREIRGLPARPRGDL